MTAIKVEEISLSKNTPSTAEQGSRPIHTMTTQDFLLRCTMALTDGVRKLKSEEQRLISELRELSDKVAEAIDWGKPLYSIEEMTILFDCNPSTIHRWEKRELILGVKISGRKYYEGEDVRALKDFHGVIEELD